MAPPTAEEVRLSPPVSRRHQFFFALFGRFGNAVAHAAPVIAVSPRYATMTPDRDGVAAPLPRRADAGDRQAGGVRRASRPEGRRKPGGSFRRAALRPAARAGAWRTGSTATPPAAWCSAATARRWRASASCSRTAPSPRPIGPSSRARPRRTKASSNSRSAASTRRRGWWMKHDPEGQPAVTKWKVMGRLRSPPPGGGGRPAGGRSGGGARPGRITPPRRRADARHDPPPAGGG